MSEPLSTADVKQPAKKGGAAKSKGQPKTEVGKDARVKPHQATIVMADHSVVTLFKLHDLAGDVPDDLAIVGASFDPVSRCVHLVAESLRFPETGNGQVKVLCELRSEIIAQFTVQLPEEGKDVPKGNKG